jgi:hypothetical protein
MMTLEFAVDRGNDLRWGKAMVPCLWPVTDVKVKAKFSLERAMKAQKGSRGIAVLFL